jgi:endoglucanase
MPSNQRPDMKSFALFLSLILAPAACPGAAFVSGSEPFVPSNPKEMQRLTDHHSPACHAAKRFMHGINLGNYLEVPPGEHWNETYSVNDFASMRAEGFDHVRVLVGWQHYTGPAPDFALSPEIFAKADWAVTNALNNHLAVIVNVCHFNAFTANPVSQTDKLLAIWRQLAIHYAKSAGPLAFELLNEPNGAATTPVMNPIYARLIAEIRQTNPRRTIFVQPGNWGAINELKNLVLPPDKNLIVSVHCYEPFYFTHQGAAWPGQDTQVTGIQYPGPPAEPLVPDPSLKLNPWVLDWIHAYNTLPADHNPSGPSAYVGQLKLARDWSDYYGRPMHVGEWGCYIKADPQSRLRQITAFRHALDAEKLGWAMWDWGALFRYWDEKNQRPLPGMHEAVFGKT